jgi:uncharacterized repeat protein (TIGR03943 family)
VLLLLLGLATAVMLAKGSYLNYVKPSLLPWLIVAAAVLVVLGLSGVLHELRSVRSESDHEHRTWLTWVLLLPVAMVAFIVPPPLDARGPNPPPTVSAPEPRPFPPLPPGLAPELSVPEFVMRAAADSAHSLDDRTVTLTGFTVGGDLGRVVIVCCAADAQLARVHLVGLGDYPDDTWLQVRGRLRPGSARVEDDYVPTLVVADAVPVEKPRNAYAY